MKTELYRSTFNIHPAKGRVALLFIALLVFGDVAVIAGHTPGPTPTQETKPTPTAGQEAPDTPKISNDQLDSLVAPIALYPDPLLSQVLVASTYPLEIVQLQQWLEKRGTVLNEKAKAEELQKQNWDPSIQAMAVLPEVVKRLSDDIKWTSDLGNAFLAQQGDVMDAVQRMRAKANNTGNLKSNEQMKVETKEVESKTVIVIEQSDPQVVYVPSYNPTVIWGATTYYPYPPIYYPPAGYYAGRAIGFGVGVAIGAAWGGGGWGWGCGWGGNDVNINVNNSFNRNTNISGGNRTNISGGNRPGAGGGNRPGAGGGGKWQHNPQHRGGAPYSNKAVANKYGGSARGDSMASRQASARQQAGSMDRGGGRQQAGSMDRGGGGRQQAGSMDRGGGGRQQAGSMDRGGGGRSSSNFGGGGGDRIGSREVSRGSGGSNRSGGSFGSKSSFGGGSFGGGSTRASSSRGSLSMGSRGGGGGRGGGGRGGRR